MLRQKWKGLAAQTSSASQEQVVGQNTPSQTPVDKDLLQNRCQNKIIAECIVRPECIHLHSMRMMVSRMWPPKAASCQTERPPF